jgi:hypothetical protein
VNPEITGIERVNLQPGDRLIVRYERFLTAQEAAAVLVRVQKWSGGAVPVLILDGGASLEVLTDSGDDVQEIARREEIR